MATQLNLFNLASPAPTVPVRLRSGAVVEARVGMRSAQAQRTHYRMADLYRNEGWRPDPAGEWFLLEWLEPKSEDHQALCRRMGLPTGPMECGVYIHESMLRQALDTGEPLDWMYQSRLRNEAMQKCGGRRRDEEGDDDGETEEAVEL